MKVLYFFPLFLQLIFLFTNLQRALKIVLYYKTPPTTNYKTPTTTKINFKVRFCHSDTSPRGGSIFTV